MYHGTRDTAGRKSKRRENSNYSVRSSSADQACVAALSISSVFLSGVFTHHRGERLSDRFPRIHITARPRAIFLSATTRSACVFLPHGVVPSSVFDGVPTRADCDPARLDPRSSRLICRPIRGNKSGKKTRPATFPDRTRRADTIYYIYTRTMTTSHSVSLTYEPSKPEQSRRGRSQRRPVGRLGITPGRRISRSSRFPSLPGWGLLRICVI